MNSDPSSGSLDKRTSVNTETMGRPSVCMCRAEVHSKHTSSLPGPSGQNCSPLLESSPRGLCHLKHLLLCPPVNLLVLLLQICALPQNRCSLPNPCTPTLKSYSLFRSCLALILDTWGKSDLGNAATLSTSSSPPPPQLRTEAGIGHALWA